MELNSVSTFAERLKIAIGDMTASELAKKIGLSKQAVSTYMTGIRSPKLPVIQALSNALNVNEAWLLGYDVPKEKGVFDTFIAAKDIPDYIKSVVKSDEELYKFLTTFYSRDEIQIINDYKELSKQGKEYMRQTMEMAKITYKKDCSSSNVDVG